MNESSHNFSFPRSHRLSGKNAFSAVFAGKMRKHGGPVTLVTRPNELGHNRLGLSVSRKVGNAIKRNRIKRLLREAFRLSQHEQAAGYDMVVIVRPHEPLLELAAYQKFLLDTLRESDKNWQRRLRRGGKQDDQTASS